MKKIQFSVFAMMIMALVCVGFASCGGDDDSDNNNNFNKSFSTDEWYMSEDFTSAWWKEKFNNYKSSDSYFSGDVFKPTSIVYSLDGSPLTTQGAGPFYSDFIHLTGNTMVYYSNACLVKYGSSSAELLFQIDAGEPIGKLACYGSSPIYFHYEREGSKIVVDYIENGEQLKQIFTVVSDGLLENGGGKWTKYNPQTMY